MKNKYEIRIFIFIAIALIIICMIPKYSSNNQNKKLTKYDMIDYLVVNLDECKEEMNKLGYECDVVSEDESGKQVRFLQIKTDDKTKIKFDTDSMSRAVDVVRDIHTNHSIELELTLIGDIPNDVKAMISVDHENGGLVSCNYKNANDFNTPEPTNRSDEKDRDKGVKAVMSTEELNQLRDKTYSVYNELMEIYQKKANVE